MSRRSSNKRNTVAVIALITALFSLTTAALHYVRPFIEPLQQRRNSSILLSYLPEKVGSTCTTDTSDDFRAAVVSLECSAKGTTVVRVSSYENSKRLYAHYRETLKGAHVAERSGRGCDKGVNSESRYYDLETNVPLGRLACWREPDNAARIEWTVSDVNVQANALSTGDLKSLYKWWEDFYIQRDNPV